MLTGEELRIVDQKLDRYVARKAERGEMTHLLIDQFQAGLPSTPSPRRSNVLKRGAPTAAAYSPRPTYSR